jgi:hypothetical protein
MKQNSFLIQNTHKMFLHVDSSSSFHSYMQQITDWKHGEGRGEEVPLKDGIDSQLQATEEQAYGCYKNWTLGVSGKCLVLFGFVLFCLLCVVVVVVVGNAESVKSHCNRQPIELGFFLLHLWAFTMLS